MNFLRRKFSFTDDEGGEMEDVSNPSAFSFQAIASKVSSTISAPTSPARTGETLAVALEKSLHSDRSRKEPAAARDAKVLLVVDSHHVDWSKYFRLNAEFAMHVEQADVDELDVVCTDQQCIVEIIQSGRDSRTFSPAALFVGAGAKRSAQLKTLLRAFMAAHVPFINSHTSAIAFLDKNNLKKQLKKITLGDGASIPFLPAVHYPHFRRFQPTSVFPVVVNVNEGFQGIGKIKVNSHEELIDVEGMLQIMSRGDTEVLVQPHIDVKYDLHVQKIGHEYKTFIRRGISRHWKSNVGSSVLEQIQTNERHKKYIKAIVDHVGPMTICSIDVLVSKEGREFVHDVNDVIAYFGESAEDDRRAAAMLLRALVAPARVPPAHVANENGGANGHPPPMPQRRPIPATSPPQAAAAPPALPRRPQAQSSVERRPSDATPTSTGGVPRADAGHESSKESMTFGDDTMGQLKRTFAGFFGDGS